MPYSHPSQDPAIRELVKEERAKQREELKRQQQAGKRATAKARRRAKHKQTPEDSWPTFIWKEFMR
jgi:hypothetical protein